MGLTSPTSDIFFFGAHWAEDSIFYAMASEAGAQGNEYTVVPVGYWFVYRLEGMIGICLLWEEGLAVVLRRVGFRLRF